MEHNVFFFQLIQKGVFITLKKNLRIILGRKMKAFVNFYLNFLPRKYLLLNEFFHGMEFIFFKQMVAMQVDFHLRAIPA